MHDIPGPKLGTQSLYAPNSIEKGVGAVGASNVSLCKFASDDLTLQKTMTVYSIETCP